MGDSMSCRYTLTEAPRRVSNAALGNPEVAACLSCLKGSVGTNQVANVVNVRKF